MLNCPTQPGLLWRTSLMLIQQSMNSIGSARANFWQRERKVFAGRSFHLMDERGEILLLPRAENLDSNLFHFNDDGETTAPPLNPGLS